MKTLYLNRHAKAGHNQGVRSDFERNLSDSGITDAAQMGGRLKSLGDIPDRMVSSPAVRALTTARLIAGELNYPFEEIDQKPELYNADTNDILGVINQLEDSLQSVSIFGHNPGLSEMVNYLAGQLTESLPTCGIAKINFEDTESWAEVSYGTGNIEYIIRPGDAS